jgi:branched-chain amino acid transport system substrate-binding protein
MKLRLNKTVAAVASSALLLMAVPAVGIASASGASAKPTYTIGYEGPLSGGNQQLGLNMVFGVQLAINQANASGQLKFKLKLRTYDDQGDPTISPTQAQAAVHNMSLVAIVGPAFSGATAASEPYYSAAHIATVSPSATRVSLATNGWHNFFRVVADDGVQGPADANYLVTKKGFKTVYVVNRRRDCDYRDCSWHLAVPERYCVGDRVLGCRHAGCGQPRRRSVLRRLLL